MTVPVSLRKSLDAVLDRGQSKRYLRNISVSAMPARYYYNTALRDLNTKDSEGAIHHLILALNSESDHEPALHLVKTMLFGLSKKFHEAGGEMHKQKYVSIGNWIVSIEQSIIDTDKRIISYNNDKAKQKNKGIWGMLQLIFFKNTIKDYDLLIQKENLKKEELKKDLIYASKLSQIEEYAKILSLILEICLYPARYAWIVA